MFLSSVTFTSFLRLSVRPWSLCLVMARPSPPLWWHRRPLSASCHGQQNVPRVRMRRMVRHTWACWAPLWPYLHLHSWCIWGPLPRLFHYDDRTSPWSQQICRQCEQYGNQGQVHIHFWSHQGGSRWWPTKRFKHEISQNTFYTNIKCSNHNKQLKYFWYEFCVPGQGSSWQPWVDRFCCLHRHFHDEFPSQTRS